MIKEISIKASEEVRDIICKCLDKNPATRYTARKLLDVIFLNSLYSFFLLKIILIVKIIYINFNIQK